MLINFVFFSLDGNIEGGAKINTAKWKLFRDVKSRRELYDD